MLWNRQIERPKGNSPPPVTCECEEIICSTKVVPERGMPTIKIGFILLETLSLLSEFSLIFE